MGIGDLDETPCSLEMGFDTTIDFAGKKKYRYPNFWKRTL